MTIWLDVEDLFEYARGLSRPSGIQRLSFELYAALQLASAKQVGFVRHDMLANTMRVCAWSEVEALYSAMTHSAPPEPKPNGVRAGGMAETPLLHGRLARMPVLGGGLRAVARRLPSDVRQPLGGALRAQVAAVRGLGGTARALFRLATAKKPRKSFPVGEGEIVGQDLRECAKPGDTLVVLGSPWSHPDYAGLVAGLKRQTGLRFAMLVYDLIPLVRPEFCERGLAMLFSGFMRSCLPIADRLMAISEATASDVASWAAQEGISICEKPVAIPIGSGFTVPAATGAPPAGLRAGEYVLFVSTIEARKNHVLAFRAWRRLLAEMPPERVPTLVFAGRIGWMVADLMQQIRNAENLGGKLVIVEGPDDATLAALYRGARFTLFPSYYEGWGLPVSESLAFGKACLASSSTSVPEAGRDFCLYHDPDSVTDAVALYRRALENPQLIAELEARIAASYAPVAWSTSAEAVLDIVG